MKAVVTPPKGPVVPERPPGVQQSYVTQKAERETGWVWCRTGNHRVRRNQIAVHYEPGFGLCGHCIVQRTRSVRDYWTLGRAPDSACDARGQRSTGEV